MKEMNEIYEQCEDCFSDVNMMDIIVKKTADGNCIYCPKCVQRHRFLGEKRLCKIMGDSYN